MNFCANHTTYLLTELEAFKLKEFIAATADEGNARMTRYAKGDVVLPDPFIVAKNLFIANVNNVLSWTGNKLVNDHCPACQYNEFFKSYKDLEIDRVWLKFAAQATQDLFNYLNFTNNKN